MFASRKQRARRRTTERTRTEGPERADAELLRVLERDWEEAASRAGEHLVCVPGCSECCRGPFPVTRLDEWRLRRGLEAVERDDPRRAARILERARGALAVLTPGWPGDPVTGRLSPDEEALDAYFERHASLACPALAPDSGRCELYAWRPISCRTYGPPVRFGEEGAPPCPLCFRGAAPETVERCRVEPDACGLEEAILEGMGEGDGAGRETLIAFALAGGGGRG